jgi:hypothetical protein
MPFLGPWFLMSLLGLAGAAIPIVLHLFFRSRYRTVPWAAMEFLLNSIEQTSRRLKFQELLLLILRCALLLLLALALARPVLSLVGSGGARDAVDAVFVIDASYSMGAREGAKTRFELAKFAALNAIDQMPPHSSVQVFTCGTTCSEPLLREPANLEQVRKVIDGLELTHLATDLGPAIAEAVKVLESSRAANKELYIFSDMQKQGFAQNAGLVNARLGRASSLATTYLVRCGTRTLANAAILEMVPQTGIPRPGQRIGFAVTVKNTSTLPVRQLQIGLAVGGAMENAETQAISELAPGESRVVALTAHFDKPGLHAVTAFLTGDDLPGDNYLDRIVEVRDKVKVLVVDGNLDLRDPGRSSSFFLVNALAPASEDKQSDYFLQTEVIPTRQAGGELLKDKAICVLVNVPLGADAEAPTSEFVDALSAFVKKGGGLMIYGGEKVQSAAYNQALGAAGLLPVPLTDAASFPLDKPVSLDRKSASLPGFEQFRTDDYFEKMNVFPIAKSLGLEEPGRQSKLQPTGQTSDGTKEGARAIFRYTNGQPAVVTRKIGFGEVLFVGTSADPGYKARSHEPTWNWLPLWGHGFVPLVQAQVNYLLHCQSQGHNSTAGEQVHFIPPQEMAQSSFVLITPGERTATGTSLLPEGDRVPLGLAATENDRPLVVTPTLARAGVYWLTTRDNDPGDRKPFAIAPDTRESADLQMLSDADIDRQLGFTPIHVSMREGGEAFFAAERTNREWTIWLLWIVLAFATGESLLAWYCSRPPLAA